MNALNPIDAGNVVNMILNENKGNVITEALIVGIQTGVIFYCNRLIANAPKEADVIALKKEMGDAGR